MVAEREIPAWQCTNTRPPLFFTESEKEMGREESDRKVDRGNSPPYLLSNSSLKTLGSGSLTNETDSLLEPGTNLHHLVIFYWNALVMEKILKMVGAVGRDIENGCDTAGLQPLKV